MITTTPISIDQHKVIAIEVELPKTTLIIITTEKGYIMCGALDIQLLNERLHDRHIVAARALGVRTVADLLSAPIESATDSAIAIGIQPGISGEDAVRKMLE